jgi:hypothetical protein
MKNLPPGRFADGLKGAITPSGATASPLLCLCYRLSVCTEPDINVGRVP